MTDRKVYVEVEWDDKDAKAKARALDIVLDNVGRTGRTSASGVGALEAAVRRAASAHQAATPAINGTRTALQAILMPAAQLRAEMTKGVFAGNAYWDMLKGGASIALGTFRSILSQAVNESTKLTNAMIGLSSVAGAFGQDIEKTKQAAQDLAKDGLMTVSEAAAGLKNLIGSRFKLDEAIQLMNAFKDAAAFNRQGQLEFGQAIVGATEGIKNQMSMMVDNAGITKNLGLILKEAGYKEQDLGRAATDAGVRHALLNGILKEAAAFAGDAERATRTYTGQMTKLDVAWRAMLATWGSAITENKTVSEAIGQVTNALIGANVEATRNGKAWYLVSDAVIGLVKLFIELLRALDLIQTGINGVIIVLAELGAGFVNLAGIIVGTTKAFLDWTRWTNPGLWFGAGKAAYESLGTTLKSLESTYNSLAQVSNNAAKRSVDHGNAIQGLVGRLKIVQVELEKTRGQTVEYGKVQGEVGKNAVKKAEEEAKAAKEVAKAHEEARDSILDGYEEWQKTLDRLQDKEDKFWEEWKKDAKEARYSVEEDINAINQAIHGMTDRKLGLDENGVMDLTSQQVFFQNYTDNVNEGYEGAKKTELTTEDILQNIIDMSMAAWDFAMAMKDASQKASMMDRQLSGMKAGARAGSMFGPWGTLIGGFVGLVVGGLLKDPKYVTIMRQVGQQWGLTISQAMGQQIEKSLPQVGGNMLAASLLNLRGIIDDVGGVTAENFGRLGLMLSDVVRGYQSGILTATQATKVLDETFADFVAAGTDGAGRLNTQLKAIVLQLRAAGLESKAFRDFMNEQATAAIEGSNAVVMSLKKEFDAYQKIADRVKTAQQAIDELNKTEERGRGVEWTREMTKAQQELTDALTDQHKASEGAKESLELMGSIALATYQAAIEAGMTHNQALLAAQPALAALRQAYENLGISAEDAGLKALLIQAGLAEKAPELLAGIDGLAKSFIALDNMGLLTVDTFRKMEAAGKNMYTRLQAETAALGGGTKDALLPMQNYLHQAAKQAELLGIELDPFTQMLIDQSKELGIWKDEGEDANRTMIDAVDELKDVMEDFINLLRGLPGEAEDAASGMQDAFNRVRPPNLGDPNAPSPEGGRVPLFAPPGYGGGTATQQQQTNTVVVVPVVAVRDADPQTIGEVAAAAVAQHIPRNGFNLRTIIAQAVEPTN